MILPTLDVPDPSNERHVGEAILHSVLSTRQGYGRSTPAERGGTVGTHWSTDSTVPLKYGFDDGPKTQTGVPLSREDIRTIRRTTHANLRDKDYEGPTLYRDLSGSRVPDARPFTASVMWHGSVVDPSRAQKTGNTWEHEVDLEHGASVAVHGFSYSIPPTGASLRGHMGRQFTRVDLPKPIMMTVDRVPRGRSFNEMLAQQAASRFQ